MFQDRGVSLTPVFQQHRTFFVQILKAQQSKTGMLEILGAWINLNLAADSLNRTVPFSGAAGSLQSGVGLGCIRLEAIAPRLENIATRLEAIAIRLEAIASRLKAIAIRLEAIAPRLDAIAIRLQAIASRWYLDEGSLLQPA